jgi:hypothetical protein
MARATRCSNGLPAESKAFAVPVGEDADAAIMAVVCLKEGTFMAQGVDRGWEGIGERRSRKPKAESRKQKAESRKQKTESNNTMERPPSAYSEHIATAFSAGERVRPGHELGVVLFIHWMPFSHSLLAVSLLCSLATSQRTYHVRHLINSSQTAHPRIYQRLVPSWPR